jgi:hypothetical protein
LPLAAIRRCQTCVCALCAGAVILVRDAGMSSRGPVSKDINALRQLLPNALCAVGVD